MFHDSGSDTCWHRLWIAIAGAVIALITLEGSLLLVTLWADLIATLIIFGFSRAYKNSSFYDAYWSVIPPLMVVF
ncbi:MAG: hypothetical protein R3F38_00040 [Gammaproteobacteria bacterium]